MHFLYFLAVFELLSVSLTAIYVELHQCPSHHSILLTQGPIWEIFAKNFENWRFWKPQFFWFGHFEFFLQKENLFFCFLPVKISPNLYGWVEILMLFLMSRKFLAMRNNALYSVCIFLTRVYKNPKKSETHCETRSPTYLNFFAYLGLEAHCFCGIQFRCWVVCPQ